MPPPGASTAVLPEPRGPLARLGRLLPEGRTLPEDVWRRRHRVLLGLVWAHAVGLTLFGLSRGYGVSHSLQEGLIVASIAVLATLAGRRRLASALVSLGLITSSAILVHLWGGVIEGHFHFFVMIVLLSLYEDWLPFLLAAAYVVLHHGLAGAIDSSSVYNHGDAIAHPWKWAAIHGAFVTAAGIGSVAAWRLNEDVRSETSHAYDQARESEERFRSAFDNAPIGMVLTSMRPDDFGRFMQANHAMCEITGLDKDVLIGRTFADVTHPEDRESSLSITKRMLGGELSSFDTEKRYVHADGHTVHVHVSVSLLRDAAGEPHYTIAQIQDITERKRAEEQLAYQAYHDQLTGLPNRRKLMDDLASRIAAATTDDPLVLALFDLDGFKTYNDTFGHPAGDALLARLGGRFAQAMANKGDVYRMGGDEFCMLAPLTGEGPEALAAVASVALSEHGEAFSVTASFGSVVLPVEASDQEEALRKADQRMYSRKGRTRTSAGRQAADALLTALSERNPDLGVHLRDVTELSEAVARLLGVSEEQIAQIAQAAALHDVGKVAIPDAILQKPGPLDPGEWEFMRTHTLIGERILGAAPALAQAAKIVRSSHERYDGKGYPDGLAGEEIPLGSCIIAVCDAYDAMRSDRPYRRALSVEGAVSELRCNSGRQFHPDVVDAFVSAIEELERVAFDSRAEEPV